MMSMADQLESVDENDPPRHGIHDAQSFSKQRVKLPTKRFKKPCAGWKLVKNPDQIEEDHGCGNSMPRSDAMFGNNATTKW